MGHKPADHGGLACGGPRLLYVSPLKALNNDVRKNLLAPIADLKDAFTRAETPFRGISVLTRSGDTPGEDRRRMLRRPPEILITTPESLNILLTSEGGRSLLAGIRTVVLDEIHAVAGSKRGTHLITAVERLVLLSGEFQRIALSATVRPLERVAEFVGGYTRPGKGDSRYEPRPVSIIRADDARRYAVSVVVPDVDAQSREMESPGSCRGRNAKGLRGRCVIKRSLRLLPEGLHSAPSPGKDIPYGKIPQERRVSSGGSWWPALIADFKRMILQHTSTLLFANSRRTTEKVPRLLNEGAPEPLAYAHHGSLAKEIRLAVEQKLKQGQLKAIVATSSLELGIDIGDLDQVILIETPRSVASTLQRIGRSGHGVGEVSRGVIAPTRAGDLVDAAVMARAVLDQDIEDIHPVESPLDVLAQVILSMTTAGQWDIDELYAFLKGTAPYHRLPRTHFDLVLDMLAGRYADARVRDLKPRVSIDRIDNTVRAGSEVSYLLYRSGGTIPERGYFDLRVKATEAKIGELDEEFGSRRRMHYRKARRGRSSTS